MVLDVRHNLEQDAIDQYVESFCGHLENGANTEPIELNRKWARIYPSRPGVYSVFIRDAVVYVGESGNVRERMMDMMDSRHHVLRRNLGLALFSKEEGFVPATAKRKFPPEFEEQLVSYIESNLRICLVTVALGRREIEECMVERHRPIYNRKGRRA